VRRSNSPATRKSGPRSPSAMWAQRLSGSATLQQELHQQQARQRGRGVRLGAPTDSLETCVSSWINAARLLFQLEQQSHDWSSGRRATKTLSQEQARRLTSYVRAAKPQRAAVESARHPWNSFGLEHSTLKNTLEHASSTLPNSKQLLKDSRDQFEDGVRATGRQDLGWPRGRLSHSRASSRWTACSNPSREPDRPVPCQVRVIFTTRTPSSRPRWPVS